MQFFITRVLLPLLGVIYLIPVSAVEIAPIIKPPYTFNSSPTGLAADTPSGNNPEEVISSWIDRNKRAVGAAPYGKLRCEYTFIPNKRAAFDYIYLGGLKITGDCGGGSTLVAQTYCPAGYTQNRAGQCQENNQPKPEKEMGAQQCQAMTDNPINIASGNKYFSETDITINNLPPFIRYYNSLDGNWRHSYQYQLDDVDISTIRTVSLGRPDGRIIRFSYISGQWQADADVFSTLKTCDEGFCFTQGLRTEKYNKEGKIISIEQKNKPSISFEYAENKITVSSDQGQQLILTLNSNEQLIAVEIPDGIKYEYTYDDQNRLTARVYEGKKIEYRYENSQFPNYITSIIDELGVVRNRVEYDEQGRAVLSELADSAEKTTLKFNSDNSTTVTNSLGKETTHYFTILNGVRKPVRVEGHASANCAAANREYTYYDNGLLKSKTDWKGITTSYEYNDRGLLTREVVASGTTSQQETLTEWHETFRLPTQVTEANRTVHYTYDDQGRLTQQTVTTDPNYSGNTGNNSGGTSGNTNENGSNSSSNNGNGSTTEQPGSKDSDNDGLTDAYETLYGLNPNKNDASDDFDNDGLTNLEEFEQGLNPTIADSLSNPLNQAIQALSPIRDFVADDITGVTLTDRSSHTNGTILSVSDQDQIEDSLTNSTNPWVSAKSFDLNGAHYLAMGPVEAKTIDNGFTWMGWMTLDSIPDWQRLFNIGNGKADNVIMLYFNKNTPELVLSLFNDTDHVMNLLQSSSLTTGQSFFIAMTYQDGRYRLFLDGKLLLDKTGPKPNSVDRNFFNIGYSFWNTSNGSYAGVNGQGVSDIQFQRIALFNKALSSSEISMLSTLSQPKENSDFDQDGMPDQFEIKYGLNIYQNDANDDADNDGLSNLEEYNRGLNPTIDENASLELNNKIKALSPIRHFVADDIIGSSVADRSGHHPAKLVSITGSNLSNSNLSISDIPNVSSKSFDLNGSHYLAMGPFKAETVDNGFTWLGWFTLDSIQNWQRLFSLGNGQRNNLLDLTFKDRTTQIASIVFNGNNDFYHYLDTNLTAGQHFFIAMTYQDGLYKVFLNGNLLFSKTGPKPNKSIDRNFFNIGYSQWKTSNGVNNRGGSDLKFQRIAIFDKPLSEAQINSLNTF